MNPKHKQFGMQMCLGYEWNMCTYECAQVRWENADISSKEIPWDINLPLYCKAVSGLPVVLSHEILKPLL